MSIPTDDVKNALAQRTRGGRSAGNKPVVAGETVFDMLKRSEGAIKRALPSMVDPEQFVRACITTIRLSQGLQKCTPISIIGGLMQMAQLGLAADIPLGQAYLVPFYNSKTGCEEAQFIIGYRGYLELIRRTGQVASIMAREVYQGDYLELEYGLEEKLVHKPALDVDPDPKAITHVYAVAHMKGGGHAMFVMTRSQVEAIRKRSKAADKGPWVTDYAAMARKTVIRQLAKYLPLSVEAQRDLARDETIRASIEDVSMPVAEDDEDTIDVTATEVETGEQHALEQAPPPDGRLV